LEKSTQEALSEVKDKVKRLTFSFFVWFAQNTNVFLAAASKKLAAITIVFSSRN